MAESPVQQGPYFLLRSVPAGLYLFHVFIFHDFFRLFFAVHLSGILIGPGLPGHFLRSFHGVIPFQGSPVSQSGIIQGLRNNISLMVP